VSSKPGIPLSMVQCYPLVCTLRHFGRISVPIYTHNSSIMAKSKFVTVGPLEAASQLMVECIHKMKIVLRSKQAVGICAPQLGFDFCLVAWRDECGRVRLLYNPTFEPLGAEKFSLQEGCLSSPGRRHIVVRARDIVVKGVNLDMEPVECSMSHLDAAILQHEIDHLEGRPWPPFSVL
jgi:peptide deformylase